MSVVEAVGALTPEGWTGPVRLHFDGGVITAIADSVNSALLA